MREAHVFCPECNWREEIESGTEEFPFYCPRQIHDPPVRVDTEIETMDFHEYHTQTDKA